jgi:choline kinase
MHGLIVAAGLSTRLQDLCDQRNKVLLDLGGETLLSNILHHFERAGIDSNWVMVGHDALAVQEHCRRQATCLLNPFFEAYGILGSVWLAQPHLAGFPFVFTTGDHYFGQARLQSLLNDQPAADVLVDVEVKTCDDEDMKVYVSHQGQFRTMNKSFLKHGLVLGEFTGMVRFSADGSSQFFETLQKYAWQHGIQGYVADVLCAYHRKWELAFHVRTEHDRIEVDFPCDLARARQLFAQERQTRTSAAS